MSNSKYKTYCPCLDSFITRLQTEDISYLYPCNWNIYPKNWINSCCFSQSSSITVNELENIKKEIEAIKKFNGFNINPLCNSDDNSNTDNIIDEDIKNLIVNLKTDLQRCNDKLDELELNVKNGIGTDAFCIVEKE